MNILDFAKEVQKSVKIFQLQAKASAGRQSFVDSKSRSCTVEWPLSRLVKYKMSPPETSCSPI